MWERPQPVHDRTIHAILRHSVDVWTVAFGFQQVGYVSAGEANQGPDYEKLQASQARVGYPSDLYQGTDARNFLKKIWADFKTDGIDAVLHEKVSGYAGTRQAIAGLTQKCRDHGVRIFSGVEVLGYDTTGDRVSRLRTNHGDIDCDAVVLGLGAPFLLRFNAPSAPRPRPRELRREFGLRPPRPESGASTDDVGRG